MSKTWKWADGDIVIDRNKGRALYIDGTEKASQDVAYFYMTITDVLRRVGCQLTNLDRLGRQAGMTKTVIQQEATDAVRRLQEWQVLDSSLTDAERIVSIEQFVVVQDSPVSFVFNMTIATATSDKVQVAYRIRLGQQFLGLTRRGLPGLVTDDNRP